MKPALSITNTPAAANTPQHVAIIMDGNGRWAKKRLLPRAAGHKKGAEALRRLLPHCRELGIPYLTVYAFSSENWNRPADEVKELMQLLKTYLETELDALIENQIRLHVIGEKEKLPPDVQALIDEAEAKTSAFSDFHLTVCLSYGARQEMMRGIQHLCQQVADGELTPAEITEERINAELFTQSLPELDLLIRTGGEQRLSNFMLWQSAYTELYFTDTLWPDFTPEHLTLACDDFSQRERRYGNCTG